MFSQSSVSKTLDLHWDKMLDPDPQWNLCRSETLPMAQNNFDHSSQDEWYMLFINNDTCFGESTTVLQISVSDPDTFFMDPDTGVFSNPDPNPGEDSTNFQKYI